MGGGVSVIRTDDDLWEPSGDVVLICDARNTAHVLRPLKGRPIFAPTICGHRMDDLAAIPHDVQELLAAPWSLLTDRQYRAWPPWPCQRCMRLLAETTPEVEAWTCRVCGAAFQCRPDQVAQRMAHHVENHRVTEEGLSNG